MDRRNFLAAAGAAAVSRKTVSAAEKVNVAVIGVRGRGRSLTKEFAALPDVNVACLCDPDSRVFSAAAKVAAESGHKPKQVADLRSVLDDKSIDAVVIATPDHWHAPATILACQSGKDVYVEKPASHNAREGRMMLDAARRHQRVVQVGTQARSRPSSQRAIEYVRSGKIGRVLMAKAWNVQLRENIGHKQDGAAPREVDYDLWTGPAPLLPFNENRFHYQWHWHWGYGTGDIGNDGVHQIDQARWALGVEWPVEVSGMGRKLFFDDDQQTPDTMNITFNFPGKVLSFEMRIWNPYGMDGQDNAVAVYGTEGMVHFGREFRAFDPKGKLVAEDTKETPDLHARNFIDCVKSRAKPNADIEVGHISTMYCHLGNIVAKTGRNLRFDPATGEIAGDPEANRLLGREYRKHWSAPKASA